MAQPAPAAALKFLVIRRDNIGDLVCTTPMLHALREHFPNARICALVNSYNLPVLQNNPDIDKVYAYTKAKHRPKGKSIIGVYMDRLRLLARLRRENFDYAILAGPGFLPRLLRLARLIKPKHIIGFTGPGKRRAAHMDLGIPYSLPHPMHEAEDIFRLLEPLGIKPPPPLMQVQPSPAELALAQQALNARQWAGGKMLIGIHISARKPSQRWAAEYFIDLIGKLRQQYDAQFILFWSPGDASNPMHPGDDAKARTIVNAIPDVPILAYPTLQLSQLIAGLALCDMVICSDGGAMHLAAGLGKPVLCFFGKSDASRWHPWGVPYVLLQPESREVADISVGDALAGFAQLRARSGIGTACSE